MDWKIIHEEQETKGAFSIKNEGKALANMTYSKAGDKMIIIDHTEVSDELRGQSVGKKLVTAAVNFAREKQLKILPLCPFAKSVFDKEEELRDVL